MSEKILISKDGVNAGTATSPNDLNYSSDYNSLKYYTAGSIQVIGTAGFPFTTRSYGTIAHNLGYYPFSMCLVNSGSDPTSFYPFGAILGNEIVQYSSMSIGTSIIRFTLRITNGGGGTAIGTSTFYYKIFRNDLNL